MPWTCKESVEEMPRKWYTVLHCKHCTVESSTVQCSSVQLSAVQCSAVQCSAVHCLHVKDFKLECQDFPPNLF